MMKKVLFGVVVICILFSMTACGDSSKQVIVTDKYATEQADIMLEKIKTCVNNNNQLGLPELFSKNARKQVDSLDDDAKHFIDIFQDRKISEIEPRLGMDPGFERGYNPDLVKISNDYILTLDDGSQYTMYISFCTIDEETPANIGIKLIFLWTCTLDETPENYEWDVKGKVVEGEDEAGIFIYEHPQD